MIDKISFLFIEGFRNLWRHKLTASTSIFSVFLTLFLIGILIIVGQNSHYPIEYFRSKYKIEVFFNNNTLDGQEKIIIEEIRGFPEVRSVTLITKKDAVRIFRDQFGEDVVKMLGYNPLPGSAVVNINKGGFEKVNLDPLIKKIQALNGVDVVRYQGRLISRLENFYQMMINLLKISSGVILLISIVVISNTIRLTIYTRRELIKTLQLLGATKLFIKVPFILEGIFQSIIGASLAFFASLWLIKASNYYLTQLISLRIQGDLYFGIGLFIISSFIGFIGSYRAVSKFL